MQVAIGVFVPLKLWLSWSRYLNQDEFETLHQGWLIYSGATQYVDFNSNHPPLAFQLLSLLNWVTSDAVTVILLGRAAALVSAVATLVLLHRIAEAVHDREAARWAVAVYAFNAMFWEWSVEIRTDLLLIPLWLGAISVLVSKNARSVARSAVLVGVLMGAAFWTNQKALFHALPIGVFILAGGSTGTWRAKHLVLALGASLIPGVLVLLQAYFSGSTGALIQHNFIDGWTLLRDSPYERWRAITLRAMLARDPGFLTLSALALFGSTGVRGNRTRWFIVAASLWMLLSFFITPGGFPYYMLHVFPLLAVVIGGWMTRVARVGAEFLPQTPGWRRILVLAGVALYAYFPLKRAAKLIVPTSPYQHEVIRVASRLAPPGSTVFDGAGTMINRADAYPHDWVLWLNRLDMLNSGELLPLLPELRRNGCRLVINTGRVRRLTSELAQALDQRFVPIWGPVRVPGFDSLTPVGEAETDFELWYSGLYESDRADALVDGLPMVGVRWLSEGWHTLRLPGGNARVKIRQAFPAVDLPSDDGDPDAFLRYFGYAY